MTRHSLQQQRRKQIEVNCGHKRKRSGSCTNQPRPKTDWASKPDLEFKLKIIKTIGDKEHGKPLFTIDCKGIFEKEIDQEVVNGDIDFAVHSLKDVPIVEQQTGTVLAAIPKRDSQHDVFISKDKIPLKALPAGSVVGTGSLRRMAEIKFIRPDLDVAANPRQRGHAAQQSPKRRVRRRSHC